jgi:hypothetical protein
MLIQPKQYSKLSQRERAVLRNEYVEFQEGLCLHCKSDLKEQPPVHITNKKINWNLFPVNFLKYPIHLQHNHDTDLTEGAVHAYCNAVLWQYYGR